MPLTELGQYFGQILYVSSQNTVLLGNDNEIYVEREVENGWIEIDKAKIEE